MMERILFIGAHHDDLELAIGGSVKRWTTEGKKIFAAISPIRSGARRMDSCFATPLA